MAIGITGANNGYSRTAADNRFLGRDGGTINGNLTVTGTLSTTLLEAISANITILDIRQYELSGFNVSGNATVQGTISASGNLITASGVTAGGGGSFNQDVTVAAGGGRGFKMGGTGIGSGFGWTGIFPDTIGLYVGYGFNINATPLLSRYAVSFLNTGTQSKLAIGLDNSFNSAVASLSTLTFYVGSSATMSLTDNGRVGIGTSTPTSVLDIPGSGDTSLPQIIVGKANHGGWMRFRRGSDGAGAAQIGYGATDGGAGFNITSGGGQGYITLTAAGGPVNVYSSNTNPFSFAANGSFGVGTIYPNAKVDVLDTTLAGSTGLSGSILNLTQTWATSGAPTSIRLDVTDTSSSASSLLMDLRIGSRSSYSFGKTTLTLPPSANSGIVWPGVSLQNQTCSITRKADDSLDIVARLGGGKYITIGGDGYGLGIFNGFLRLNTGLREVYLSADDNNIFAQRNSGSPQAYRLYNTYSNATTFERLNLRWDTNVIKIGTEKGAAGGAARDLAFETDATTRMHITSAGNIGIATTAPGNILHLDCTLNRGILLTNSTQAPNRANYFINAGNGGAYNCLNISESYDNILYGHIQAYARSLYLGGFANATSVASVTVLNDQNKLDLLQLRQGLIGSSTVFKVASSGDTTIYGSVSAVRYLGLQDSLSGNPILVGGNSTGSNLLIGTNDNYALNLETAGTTKMTITSAGKVGIGTSAPEANLDIVGTGLVSIAARSSTGAFDGAYFSAVGQYESFFNVFANANTSGSRIMRFGNSNTSTFVIQALNDAGNAILRTPVSISNAAPTGSLHILSSGSVGIGTTSPTVKLEVAGDGRFTGTYPYIDLKPNGWASPFYFQSGVNTLGTIAGDYTLFLNPLTKGFAFNQGSVSRFVVDAATGNIGIGTTAPTDKLTVVGTISSNSTVYGNVFTVPANGIINSNTANGGYIQFVSNLLTTFHNGAVGVNRDDGFICSDARGYSWNNGLTTGDIALRRLDINTLIIGNRFGTATRNLAIASLSATGNLTVIGTVSSSNVIYASGGNSDLWNSSYSTVNAISANGATTYTTVNANSANWSNAYTITNANSANWSSVYTTYNAVSADILRGTISSSGQGNITIPRLNGANESITIGELGTGGNPTFNNLTVSGNLSVIGDFTYLNTAVSVTSALSVVNTGTGPALYVKQSGTTPIAHFIDADGTGDIIFENNGFVGLGTGSPNQRLSVVGNISSTGVIYASGGNSDLWNSIYTTTNANSANYILDGGNTKGANILIGTNDNYDLNFETAGTTRMTITSAGNIGITGSVSLASPGTSGFITTSNGGVSDTLLGKIGNMSTSGFLTKSDGVIGFSSGQVFSTSTADTSITRRGPANLRLGIADVAAPVAQTLSVQSVVAGTTNTPGANFTITGSQGTGTGAGGSIIFQTAPAGSSGTAQNLLSSSIVIDGQGVLNIPAAPAANTTGMLRVVHEQTGQLRPGIYATSYGDICLATYGNGGPSNVGCMYSKFIFSKRGIVVGASGPYAYNQTGQVADGIYFGGGAATTDISLGRDAAGILAQRDSVNPQAFRLYNTFTDTVSAFERLNIKWDTNVIKIGTEKGSVSGSARAIELQTDDTTRMTITSGGNVGIKTINPDSLLDVYLNPLNDYTTEKVTFGRNIKFANSTGNFAGIWLGNITPVNINFTLVGNGTDVYLNGGTLNFQTNNNDRMKITSAGNVGIGITAPAEKLDVVGNVKISGHLSAATKSFLIDHPTKEGKKLQYGVVESNQHSVLVRGKTAENIIELPEEWSGLVHEDSVTVQLTPIGSYQQLFVISQDNQRVVVGGSTGQYNYTIYGERKDVDKLQTVV